MLTWFWFNQCHAGEPAECRQNGELAGEVKTWEPEALLTRPCQPDTGMDMTRNVIIGVGNMFRKQIVYKTKLSNHQLLLMDQKVHILVIFTSQHIVISDDQVHPQPWQVVPPLMEPIVLQVSTTVKQITNKDHVVRLEMLDLMPEPLQVLLIQFRGHSNALAPEMPRFSEMQI